MYVKLENGIPVDWPVGEYQIRAAYPQSCLPEYLTASVVESLGYGVFIVNGYPAGYQPEWQNIEEIAPVLKEDGKYHQSYKITEKYTPEEKQRIQDEQARQANKAQAMNLLADTDWTQLPDVGLINQSDFVAYRSAVRQIAVNPPVTVTEWPTKPDEVWLNVE